jgi:hypothetical protein
MRKMAIAIMVATVSLSGIGAASAQSKIRPPKTVTLTSAQFERLIASINPQTQPLAEKVVERGERGERGANGTNGSNGMQGERGLAGARGEAGPKGEKGDKGDPGDAASAAIPSGAMALFHGSCPEGWAANGWENKWAVYNVKVDGRPWTEGGDQLTLTACIRN